MSSIEPLDVVVYRTYGGRVRRLEVEQTDFAGGFVGVLVDEDGERVKGEAGRFRYFGMPDQVEEHYRGGVAVS